MNPAILKEIGLTYVLAGSDYNFRYAQVKDQVFMDIDRALEELEEPISGIYQAQQVHSARIVDVNQVAGKAFGPTTLFPYTDGLITNRSGQVLVIKFADCTPVLVFDRHQQVLVVLHAGWRGTVKGIARQAVDRLRQDYGCHLDDMLALVGPSIGQDQYEVGQEVYQAFAALADRDSYFSPREGKWLLDMNEANRAQLLKAGLKDNQVLMDSRSTFTSPDLHSSRQEGEGYGLNAILVMIPEK